VVVGDPVRVGVWVCGVGLPVRVVVGVVVPAVRVAVGEPVGLPVRVAVGDDDGRGLGEGVGEGEGGDVGVDDGRVVGVKVRVGVGGCGVDVHTGTARSPEMSGDCAHGTVGDAAIRAAPERTSGRPSATIRTAKPRPRGSFAMLVPPTNHRMTKRKRKRVRRHP
jgi:hypothetical protein